MKDNNKTKKQLIQELAELRLQNAALEKSESAEKYQSLVESIKDVLYELDSQGVVLYISPAIRDLLGYDSTEIVGKNFINLAHKDDQSSLEEWFSELRKGREDPSEYRFTNKSGEIRWARTNTRPIMEDGQFKGAHGILIDITAQKRMEVTLRESEEKYCELVKNAPAGIYEVDYETNLFTRVNDVICEYTGYTRDELLTMNLFNLLTEESQKLMFARLEKLMAGEETPQTIEYCIRTKGGEELWILLNARYIYEAGKLKGATGVIYNITDRRKAEEALRESEGLLRGYLENAPDGIYMNDLEGTFIYGNRKCEEITGYQREALIGKNILELNLLSENSLNKAAQLLQANMEGKSTGPDEIDLISKEGRVIPVEINTKVIQRIGQRIVLAFVRDISDRKLAEEGLRKSEERYRTILEDIDEGYFENDLAGNFTFVNDAECRDLGYSREELIGMSYRQYCDEATAKKLYELFYDIYNTGKPIKRYPGQFISKDGMHHFNEVSASLIRDAKGKPIGFRGISQDVTDRKRAEEQLQQTLESLRKAVGTTIQVISSTVEARDPYTSGHQLRSTDLARAIAMEMGLTQDKIDAIRMAGSIHDIGKISIPAEILSKPTKLSELEFSLIKEHARKGYEMLKDVESPWPLAEIVYQHHERIDGSGYPRNLKGEEICIEARILSVADVVEAMASHRPYRAGLGIDAALNEIEKNRGIFYDSAVADACLKLFREKGFKLEGT